MHPEIQNVVQIENGPRFARRGEYKGTPIEVVSGYDITHDNWPFHVYLVTPDGQKARLFEAPTQYRAHTLESAYDQGMEMAVHYLNPPPGGFQREVK